MAVIFNEEELNQLIGVLTNTPDVIKTQYIQPCTNTLKECGLEADLQKTVDDAADAMAENFQNDLVQFGKIRDSFISFNEDVKAAYEEAMAKINSLKQASEDATKAETTTRARKMKV